jgi:hypothetical protein
MELLLFLIYSQVLCVKLYNRIQIYVNSGKWIYSMQKIYKYRIAL